MHPQFSKTKKAEMKYLGFYIGVFEIRFRSPEPRLQWCISKCFSFLGE